jgi:hypothetical protein
MFGVLKHILRGGKSYDNGSDHTIHPPIRPCGLLQLEVQNSWEYP